MGYLRRFWGKLHIEFSETHSLSRRMRKTLAQLNVRDAVVADGWAGWQAGQARVAWWRAGAVGWQGRVAGRMGVAGRVVGGEWIF